MVSRNRHRYWGQHYDKWFSVRRRASSRSAYRSQEHLFYFIVVLILVKKIKQESYVCFFVFLFVILLVSTFTLYAKMTSFPTKLPDNLPQRYKVLNKSHLDVCRRLMSIEPPKLLHRFMAESNGCPDYRTIIKIFLAVSMHKICLS